MARAVRHSMLTISAMSLRVVISARLSFIYGGGSYTAPGGINLNMFFIGNSGNPFNITTGRDTNGDTFFSERPAFATDLNEPGVVVTPLGAFDPTPSPGQTIIPRNFGRGPGLSFVEHEYREDVQVWQSDRAENAAARRAKHNACDWWRSETTGEAAGPATVRDQLLVKCDERFQPDEQGRARGKHVVTVFPAIAVWVKPVLLSVPEADRPAIA